MSDIIDTQAAYRDKAQAKLELFEAKIAELKAKAKDSTSDVRIAIDSKIHDLETRLSEGRTHVAELQQDKADGWEHLKDKLEGIFEAVQEKLSN